MRYVDITVTARLNLPMSNVSTPLLVGRLVKSYVDALYGDLETPRRPPLPAA